MRCLSDSEIKLFNLNGKKRVKRVYEVSKYYHRYFVLRLINAKWVVKEDVLSWILEKKLHQYKINWY